MNKFTIYCTEDQTKKALELGGAPLGEFCGLCPTTSIDGILYDIPTAEQMIGWLEEQGTIYNIVVEHFIEEDTKWAYIIWLNNEGYYKNNASDKGYNSRKEATLAAIDAALEYIVDNSKVKYETNN